jgi:1-acyl-sn-glycerol-3-phosphate acyltransferase
MRSIFVALVTSILTLTLGPLVILARVFRVPQGPRSIYAKCIRAWARGINWAAGVKVVVHGAERLQNAGGAVFVANHVSWFDIFSLASVVPWCSFVAKSELRKILLFGFAAEAAGIVFVDRDNRKQAFASYEAAAKEIRRGRSIVVCPEGTRGEDYHLRPFKKGPFVLAIASQTPVIPTIVHGTIAIMPKGTFRVRPGRVDIHFLTPIPTAGLEYDERAELMTTTWSAMADELRTRYGAYTNEHPVANQA